MSVQYVTQHTVTCTAALSACQSDMLHNILSHVQQHYLHVSPICYTTYCHMYSSIICMSVRYVTQHTVTFTAALSACQSDMLHNILSHLQQHYLHVSPICYTTYCHMYSSIICMSVQYVTQHTVTRISVCTKTIHTLNYINFNYMFLTSS